MPLSSYTYIYEGKSESKVPYFIATKQLHIVRCLFIHLKFRHWPLDGSTFIAQAPQFSWTTQFRNGYCTVCVWTQEERWNDGAGKFLSTRPTARIWHLRTSSLPQHEKNIFMPSDSNHMMMSSLRCKHGCMVRIPPSINRVLRNGFPA